MVLISYSHLTICRSFDLHSANKNPDLSDQMRQVANQSGLKSAQSAGFKRRIFQTEQSPGYL